MAVLLALAFCATSNAQSSFHVKSVHKETAEEHGGDRTMFRYLKVVGTLDGKTYTVESMDAGWNERLEVGKDYPAVLKKNAIAIEVLWKGKAEKNSWRILTVEE